MRENILRSEEKLLVKKTFDWCWGPYDDDDDDIPEEWTD